MQYITNKKNSLLNIAAARYHDNVILGRSLKLIY